MINHCQSDNRTRSQMEKWRAQEAEGGQDGWYQKLPLMENNLGRMLWALGYSVRLPRNPCLTFLLCWNGCTGLPGAQHWGEIHRVCFPSCRLCLLLSSPRRRPWNQNSRWWWGREQPPSWQARCWALRSPAPSQTSCSPVASPAGFARLRVRLKVFGGCEQGCPSEVTVVGEIVLLCGYLCFRFYIFYLLYFMLSAMDLTQYLSQGQVCLIFRLTMWKGSCLETDGTL